ncbi:MAG: PEP-CTERM sorting domain-containing protein [Opitutaceae bacterium]
MNITSKIKLTCIACSAIFTQASYGVISLDFEGLNTGATIVGQDGWAEYNSQGDRNNATATTTSGLYTGGVALTANINGANQVDRAASWGVTSTTLTIQADVFDGNSGTSQAAYAPIGGHGTGTEEVGPMVGLKNGNFFIRETDFGSNVTSTESYDLGDWYQVQLRIDTTANSGDGSGDFYARNLSENETAFTAIASLQNINLKLSNFETAANSNPANWDGAYAYLIGSGNVDRIDNLTIVPEPSSSATIAAVLALAFVARRRR